MRYLLASLVALVASCGTAIGQCGPGGCSVPLVRAGNDAASQVHYEWRRHNDDQDLLYANGVCLGGWDYETSTFTEWLGQRWGRVGLRCPIAPPTRVVAQLPTGVDESKLLGGEKATRRGVAISIEDARHVIEGGVDVSQLKDDSHLQRITIISKDDAKRAAARKEIEASDVLRGARPKLVVWDASSDDWSVKDSGFKCDGDCIYLQAPDGRVLMRQDSLDVKGVVDALRKRRDDYDPKRDPSGIGSDVWARIKEMLGVKIPAGAAVGGAMVVALLMLCMLRQPK